MTRQGGQQLCVGPALDGRAPGPPDRRTIEDWLVRRLSEHLQAPPESLDLDAPLVDFGLSSQEFVALSGELEDCLGCTLSPTLAWEFPNIAALAAHLAEVVASTHER